MDEIKSCPFCGGEAKRFTIGEGEPNNAGGDVICCTRCQASSHVEFGRKENLVSRWNSRTPSANREVDQWQPIETAPHAMHFLAAYFYGEGGEWIYDIAAWHRDHVCGTNDGTGPWTHWRLLPEPPQAALSAISGVGR